MKKFVLIALAVVLFSQFALASAPAPSWGDIPARENWIDRGDRWYDAKWNLSIPKEFTAWAHQAYLQRLAIERWAAEFNAKSVK